MERWVYLDGVRGLAAIMVAVFHYQALFAQNQFFDFGYLAVDVFFVLSGMVLQGMYGSLIVNGGLSAREFAIARLRRLYPVVAVSMACVAVLNAAGVAGSNVSAHSSDALMRGFLLIPSTGTSVAFPANGPLWSLLCEVLVNIVWYLVLRVGGQRAFLAMTTISVSAATGMVLLHGGSTNFGWQGDAALIGQGLVRALGAFCVGTMLTQYRASVDGLLRGAPTAALLTVVLTLVCSRSVLQQALPLASDIVPLAGGVLGLCLLRTWRAPRWLAGTLGWLGAVSYPVYLLHAPVGRLCLAMRNVAQGLADDQFYGVASSPLRFALPGSAGVFFLVALLVGASVVHYGYEKPIQSWLRWRR